MKNLKSKYRSVTSKFIVKKLVPLEFLQFEYVKEENRLDSEYLPSIVVRE